MTASDVLVVLSVPSGRRIGTVELTGDGALHAAPRGVQGMVHRMSEVRGWSGPREAFDGLAGWSNGYLEIVATCPVARVFDGLDPDTGEPCFTSGHPRIADPAERARLAGFLTAGRPVLTTAAREIDRVDRTRGEVVPLSFRTDGCWIWTDAVVHYLEVHGLAPDAELVSHIVAAGYECPAVDDAAAERALRALYRFSSSAGAWRARTRRMSASAATGREASRTSAPGSGAPPSPRWGWRAGRVPRAG